MDNLKVRTGRPNDIEPMMELALSACADNGLSNPNPVKLLNEIWPALNLDRGIVGIVDEEPISAAALLRIDRLWYSDEESLVERAIFVSPDHRAAKGGRARLLCEWVKGVQESMSMPLIIGILSSHRTAAKVKLYQRQFGEPAGAYWILGKKTGLPELGTAE